MWEHVLSFDIGKDLRIRWVNVLLLATLSGMLLHAETLIEPIPESINANWEKVKLGKKLFFDPLLSKDGTVSCATCHDLQNGGDDGLQFSFGIKGQKGSINSPTVYNAVFNFRQFWNGRARDLKEQVKGPIENPVEMGHSLQGAADSLKKDPAYQELFKKIYKDGITQENVTDAIAEFEKILITPNAPFDRYLRGEKDAISQKAKKGYQVFVSKGCILCHHGVNVGGSLFNKFGIFHRTKSDDLGRYTVTGREEDKYVFKVPSLRNIDQTAPYMHDGSIKILRDAVLLMSQYQLGREITPQEIDAIVAFLKTLSAPVPAIAK